MADMIGDAERYMNGVLEEHCSIMVSYLFSGESEPLPVRAIVGKTLFRTSEMSGLAAYVNSVDFIVDADSLGRYPSNGDRIVNGDKVFEVFSIDGEPCWRYSGDTMTKYRIHTHEICADGKNI